MASTIKSIPVLEGDVARKFMKNADSASKQKKAVDFSEQIKSANKILKKAGLK